MVQFSRAQDDAAQGFLEYGPPGFKEYGPPKYEAIQPLAAIQVRIFLISHPDN